MHAQARKEASDKVMQSKLEDISRAKKLHEKGYSNVIITTMMEKSESSVRKLLRED